MEASLRWLSSLALEQAGFSAQTLCWLTQSGSFRAQFYVNIRANCKQVWTLPWDNILPFHRTIPTGTPTSTSEGSPLSVRIGHLHEDKEAPLCAPMLLLEVTRRGSHSMGKQWDNVKQIPLSITGIAVMVKNKEQTFSPRQQCLNKAWQNCWVGSRVSVTTGNTLKKHGHAQMPRTKVRRETAIYWL